MSKLRGLSHAKVIAMSQPCNLCGIAAFDLVGDCDRRGRPLRTTLCRTCGLIAHESIPAADALRAFYREQYRRDYKGVATPAAHRVLRAWNLGGNLVRKLRPFVSAGERVFEIGAGMGATVKQFERAGFVASGNEPDRGSREFGVTYLKADLTDGELTDLPQAPQFDLIVLHHVLEHLPAPRQALEHLRRLLLPGGRAYVEVPNAAAPHAAPGKMFHAAHIYNFTPGTLTALANAAGLDVKHVFTAPKKEVIGLLLTPDLQAVSRVDFTGEYAATKAALERYSTLTYHARPRYLAERFLRGVRLAADQVAARARLRSILAECVESAASTSIARAA